MNIKYFDNSATTRVKEAVFNEMFPYLSLEYGNPSSVYGLGRRARKSEKKLNVKPKSIENKTDKNTSLKDELNKAIREERYEDAAKLRDKIKKIEKEDK